VSLSGYVRSIAGRPSRPRPSRTGRAGLPASRWLANRERTSIARCPQLLELIRLSDRILAAAGALLTPELRTIDAIHVAIALELGGDLARLVTYDERLRTAARANGCAVAAPD